MIILTIPSRDELPLKWALSSGKQDISIFSKFFKALSRILMDFAVNLLREKPQVLSQGLPSHDFFKISGFAMMAAPTGPGQ